MKFYYTPGTCARALHIALRESGLEFEPVRVDLAAKLLADGSSYLAINGKGAVPALQLDDGSILTENAVLLQWVADHAPQSGLLPSEGIERYRVLEWVNFIATELHKGFGPVFKLQLDDVARSALIDGLRQRFDWIEPRLAGGPFLTGEAFTVADAYLFTISGWLAFVGLTTDPWPNLTAFCARVASRQAVKDALEVEAAA